MGCAELKNPNRVDFFAKMEYNAVKRAEPEGFPTCESKILWLQMF
jgi:hypothetical protein